MHVFVYNGTTYQVIKTLAGILCHHAVEEGSPCLSTWWLRNMAIQHWSHSPHMLRHCAVLWMEPVSISLTQVLPGAVLNDQAHTPHDQYPLQVATCPVVWLLSFKV